MAVIGNTYLTLYDWAKRKDPSGQGVAKIVEMMTKRNDHLQDMPVVEGNLDTGHQITSRTGLPAISYRRLNQGVDASKSAVDSFIETAAMLEANSMIDVDHPGLKRGGPAFRRSEDTAFTQAFEQEVATGIFYNSTKTSIEKFHGLAPRFDALSGFDAATQITSVGGSGSDTTSIWLIGWGPNTVYGFFPAGMMGGFDIQDKGEQLVEDQDGKKFWALVTRFTWKIGLAVEDYRYIARICNIDTGTGQEPALTDLKIALAMEDAIAAIYAPEAANLRFYMNRWTFSRLNKELMAKSANLLEWIDMGGRRIPSFLGVPIRISDAITKTETALT